MLLIKAKKLIHAAKVSNADAVKFQTHNVDDEILKINFSSPHFEGQDRFEWVKRNQLSTPKKSFWIPLKEYCEREKIEFFSTPMSVGAARILEDLDVSTYKVGSGDVTDFPLIDFICSTKKPIIISTGMISIKELQEVVEFIKNKGNSLTILYCVSKYPSNEDDFNFSTISFLKKLFPFANVGFSDHTVNSYKTVLKAYEKGASVFEKHFSFDRGLWGSDHKVSLMPHEFKEMTNLVSKFKHNTNPLNEDNLSLKEFEGASSIFRPIFNKGLIYNNDLNKGDKINKSNLVSRRPLKALAVGAWTLTSLLGKTLNKDVKKGKPVNLEDFLD